MSRKFLESYQETKNAVYSYLLYMTRDRETALDLSQETYLKMYLNLNRFREACSVKTWALRIAHNTFVSYAKKKQPLLLDEQSFEKEATYYQNEPEDLALQMEERVHIENVMMTLNEQERTILLLCDYENLSYDEIAMIMKTNSNAIKSRIYRARQKFRTTYETYYGKRENGGK